jgi:hypothetical protein
MLSTLRVLRESVRRRRPVSMPNLIRLYRRHISACIPPPTAKSVDTCASILTKLYRTEQPFRGTNWAQYRRELPDHASVGGPVN